MVKRISYFLDKGVLKIANEIETEEFNSIWSPSKVTFGYLYKPIHDQIGISDMLQTSESLI